MYSHRSLTCVCRTPVTCWAWGHRKELSQCPCPGRALSSGEGKMSPCGVTGAGARPEERLPCLAQERG